MQNKGLIRFFAILFAIVCLYQLSFTFSARHFESKAHDYANSPEVKALAHDMAGGDAIREQALYDSLVNAREAYYIDSISETTAEKSLWWNYKGSKAREINLGLDLKGGMNVMMEVSTVDVVIALGNHTKDSVFNAAINEALKQQKVTPNTNFVSLFEDAIFKIKPDVQLAPYFATQLRDKVKLTDDNKKVMDVVRSEVSDAYDRTYEILRQRIDKFGVAQPNIQKLSASERILIELPGVKEPERVRKLLQGTAELQFWLGAKCKDAFHFLEDVNKYIASTTVGDTAADQAVDSLMANLTPDTAATDTAKNDVLSQLTKDSTQLQNEQLQAENEKNNPLFAKLYPNVNPENGQFSDGCVVGYASPKDRGAIDEMLDKARQKNILPPTIKFLWGAKPSRYNNLYELYAIQVTTRDGSPLLGGDVITDARQDFNNTNGNEISMTMNSDGAREWKRITGANTGEFIAIVLDNLVYSAPRVNGEIAGGRSSITGDFTLEEAKDLANILKAGKLPAPAKIVQEAVVGPSLGQESINAGLLSFIVAFIMVFIYMIIFYNKAGIVATIALLTNMFFLVGVIASLGAVLTLPGIAGIVLTMAMAVDANVIIYERVKEELRAGNSISSSVDKGFKNAYSAIIDGNVTTLLTGIVLIMFGSGPVQGFAVTLCVGILTSLFTSIFITHLVIERFMKSSKPMTFSFPFSENFLRNTNVDFVAKRKAFYIIAGAVLLIGIAALAIRGLNMGIDFQGGRTYVIRFDQPLASTADVRASLAEQFPDAPEVKTYGPSNQIKVTTKFGINEDNDTIKNQIVEKLYNGTKQYFKNDITIKEFASTETNPLGIISSEIVGPTMAKDIQRDAVIALVVGLMVIFAYIALRFRKWQFGLGGVIALAHDSLVTIGLFALLHGLLPFNMEVDQSFIAAILTVIGYSINATVVIYDRVREYKKLYPKRSLKEQINSAVNSTLSRTVNSSGTTLVVLLMMFIFGGEALRGFIFALLVGVAAGTFSSVCISGTILYDLMKRKEEKQIEK
ncbi:MAG: protein translocase subunit SecDF [Bacteroidales bacterium]|nr:protein translocase subunit SecDF [Bacteroidales bacterium]